MSLDIVTTVLGKHGSLQVWVGSDEELQAVSKVAEEVIVMYRNKGQNEWKLSSLGISPKDVLRTANAALNEALKLETKPEHRPAPIQTQSEPLGRETLGVIAKLRMPFKIGALPP